MFIVSRIVYLKRRFKGVILNIILNDESRTVAENCTVQQLLADMDIVGQRLAVEVNEEIVPKSRHDSFVFSEGDKVEIVHAIGGG